MIFFNAPTQNLFNYFSFFEPLEESTINSIFNIASNLESKEGIIGAPDALQYHRKAQVKWIKLNDSSQELYRHLELLVSIANQDYYNFDISLSVDDMQYTEYYGSDKGKHDWHQDTLPENPDKRKLSIVIQLSDPNEYEGGELQIKKYDVLEPDAIFTIPRQKGLITVFPSYMIHRVTPVTKGIRKSLVWWVGGAPFR